MKRKTISIEPDVYRKIARLRAPRETLSEALRRLIPAATAAELAEELDRYASDFWRPRPATRRRVRR